MSNQSLTESEKNSFKSNSNFVGIKRHPIKHLTGKPRVVLITFFIECNHANNDNFIFDGKLYPLKKGQWLTSIKNIEKLTGFTSRNIRTAIKNLKNLVDLEAKSVHKRATLLSLDNIDFYLISKDDLTKQKANKMTKRRQSNVNQVTTNNKNNNYNKDSNNKYNYDDFHLSIAESLSKHIQSKKQISITKSQIDSWAKDVALLESKDLKDRKSAFNDIKNALNAIIKYDGEQFFPVIESGKGFRSKFVKIESFLTRIDKVNHNKNDFTRNVSASLNAINNALIEGGQDEL